MFGEFVSLIMSVPEEITRPCETPTGTKTLSVITFPGSGREREGGGGELIESCGYTRPGEHEPHRALDATLKRQHTRPRYNKQPE